MSVGGEMTRPSGMRTPRLMSGATTPGLRTPGGSAAHPDDIAHARAQEVRRLRGLVQALEPAGPVMADEVADLRARIATAQAEEAQALEMAKTAPPRKSRATSPNARGTRPQSGAVSPRSPRSPRSGTRTPVIQSAVVLDKQLAGIREQASALEQASE